MHEEKKGIRKPYIKICGLSRPCDIDFVNEARPDYCGFILGYPKSRRNITVQQLFTLRERLADGVTPVGVFVDAPLEAILPLTRNGTLGAVQLHGNETAEYIRVLKEECGVPVIKAFRISETGNGSPQDGSQGLAVRMRPRDGSQGLSECVRPRENGSHASAGGMDAALGVLKEAVKSPADLILLDSGTGSGRTFNWSYAAAVKRPFFLAGGLGPENLASAVASVRPWGVDMSSGVETDGVKDREKILAAVAMARSCSSPGSQ